MKLPKPISNLIDYFERLPGIGPKTAQRLTFSLLNFPQEELEKFSGYLTDLKKETKLCSICKNVTEYDICSVCDDPMRDKKIIAVVASPLDAFALEKTNFKGVYHVLHGIIDPLNNVGPEDLFIRELIERLKILVSDISFENVDNSRIIEVILATNTSMEGESTAMYISKLIRESGFSDKDVKITRIARGLPVGGDIEYADDITLTRALEGRSEL
ncbi:MAG TPA: recombination mediator RecR [bacterium]|jgi:recombination protein RecR|nr:recombination mediator RecR [bacterium]HOV97567.1 recombination mediator RecR [bacterium]HQG58434.1 recombination mediator RecR [bacterium]HQG78872.1 recombination mediator RecR [bacterium]HQK41603.1 recombination mediator RecR [bacterium]